MGKQSGMHPEGQNDKLLQQSSDIAESVFLVSYCPHSVAEPSQGPGPSETAFLAPPLWIFDMWLLNRA